MTAQAIVAAHPSWCRIDHSPEDACLGVSKFFDLALEPHIEMEPGVLPIADFLSLTIEGDTTDDKGRPAIQLAHAGMLVAHLTADEAAQLAVELVGLVTAARSAKR